MAGNTEEINIKVKSDIGDVSKDASNAATEFKVMGVSLNGVKKAFAGAAVTAKGMFGSIRAGMISTGIGAFVVAIGSLVSYFTNTKRGADKLQRAMAGLGAVVDVLTDAFSELGGIILDTFQDPMPALKTFGEGLLKFLKDPTGATRDMFVKAAIAAHEFKNELEEETAAMMALKKRTQELRDADMEFMVQKAKTRQEIERARLIAEDETKSAKERLDNLKKALELEEKTTNRELELARERMEIQKQEMALSENLVADEQKLAELKTAIIEKETASIKMRRRVVTEVNALEREIQAAQKVEDDAFWNAKIAANDEWNKQQLKNAEDEIALAKKVALAKITADEAVKKSKLQLASAIGGALGKMSGLMKEGTAAAKTTAIAEIAINTGVGFVQGLDIAQKSAAAAGPGAAFAFPIFYATQIMAVLAAAAQAKSILGAGGGGGGGGGGIGGASAQPPTPQMMSGAFDISGGIKPEPVKAFVITDEMTSSQNQLANIRRRATI